MTNCIKNELERNQRLISLIEENKSSGPAGSISVDVRGNSVFCYERIYDGNKMVQKNYLGSAKSPQVQNHLAERYRKELRRRLKHNERILRRTANDLLDCRHQAIISALPKTYQRIAAVNKKAGFLDTRYEELKRWASADYEKNEYPYPKSKNYAKDGTRVRSKGECIIYNILMDLGILFRYESVIRVKDQNGMVKTLSPDFLIQCFDGSFIIIEHLGGLNDLKYAIDFGEKCHWYLRTGFIPGKNFFVTSDDIDNGTDSKAIMSVVKQVENLFYGF